MVIKRVLYVLFTLVMSVAMLAGCNKPTQNMKYDKDTPASSLSSQVIAQSSDFALIWKDEVKCVQMESLSDGKIWSSIPTEYLMSGGTGASANSPLYITVANNTTLNWETIPGYIGAVSDGRVFSEKIKNGIRVTYCFDSFEISIPVNYVLRRDSLSVTIDASEIIENGIEYSLVSVSLAPFLCSAQNESPNSYLFVPSGSGALMYTKENADGIRRYSGEIYGEDAARSIEKLPTDDEPARLPVYGAKDGENALLAIVESGAASAIIEAEAGNDRTGHSTVYSTFYYRGYDIFRHGSYAQGNSVITRVSKSIYKHKSVVGFYPLSGENADYNGMAKRYRQYLQDIGTLTPSGENQSSYSITLLGGTLTTSSVLGLPRKTLKSMTTFLQADNIIRELVKTTGINPTVRLMGYGDCGVNPGKVAGGYKFPDVFGKDKQRKNLEAYCADTGISLFTDFDLVRYSSSGQGFSYQENAAKNTMQFQTTRYPVTPLRLFNEEMPYRLLGREHLNEAIDKLLKTADRIDISRISLSTLGSLAYSDYSDGKYAVKDNIESDVGNYIEKARTTGRAVAVGSANAYAAAVGDVIFDVPMDNGSYNALDETVPFYQMVFKASKPLYSPAVNLSADFNKELMLSASGGTGLGFTLIHDFDVSYSETGTEKLYGALYKNNIARIQQSLAEYVRFYNQIAEAGIDRYEILPDKVGKTVFSNGVILYTNKTDKKAISPAGVLEAYGFVTE